MKYKGLELSFWLYCSMQLHSCRDSIPCRVRGNKSVTVVSHEAKEVYVNNQFLSIYIQRSKKLGNMKGH
jgi:hypothetical protein